MFFKKKNNNSMPQNRLQNLDKRGLKYVTERTVDYKEITLGHGGGINIIGSDFVVICGGNVVMRCPLSEVSVAELMNLSGITVKGLDKESGTQRNLIAYFSDGTVKV